MMLAESEKAVLDTVQVYSPPVVTVRVCVYCAVTRSSNTVLVPSVIVVESLVQVTVVAGPPVEIQVRVIMTESNVTSSPDIVMVPTCRHTEDYDDNGVTCSFEMQNKELYDVMAMK